MSKRQLLLLRHGKSDWDTAVASDFERPLTKRGKQSAAQVAEWLKKQGLIPDYIVSSPAKRAAKTARLVCRALGIEKEQIKWDPRIYEGEAADLLAVLRDCRKSAKTAMLVGHNPDLELLLEHLCGPELPRTEDGKLLPTAAVAWVEISGRWEDIQAGAAQLRAILRPRSLNNGGAAGD